MQQHTANCFRVLQNLRPLIIGFLVNVKAGALVLLTPSGEVADLPSRFTKRQANSNCMQALYRTHTSPSAQHSSLFFERRLSSVSLLCHSVFATIAHLDGILCCIGMSKHEMLTYKDYYTTLRSATLAVGSGVAMQGHCTKA